MKEVNKMWCGEDAGNKGESMCQVVICKGDPREEEQEEGKDENSRSLSIEGLDRMRGGDRGKGTGGNTSPEDM
jgi:hypothetical protein